MISIAADPASAPTGPEDGSDEATSGVAVDGRRLRRDRNARAVVDGVIALLFEGCEHPTAQQIADRSGVSLRSVFRYFPDLDVLFSVAALTQIDRDAGLFDFDPPGPEAPLSARIDYLAATRSRRTATLLQWGWSVIRRAPALPEVERSILALRRDSIEEITLLFAPEWERRSAVDQRHLAAMVHTLTSLESCEHLRTLHGIVGDDLEAYFRFSIATVLGAGVPG